MSKFPNFQISSTDFASEGPPAPDTVMKAPTPLLDTRGSSIKTRSGDVLDTRILGSRSALNVYTPPFKNSINGDHYITTKVINKGADDHLHYRLPPPLIPIQSSGLSAYNTSVPSQGIKASSYGRLPMLTHQQPMNLSVPLQSTHQVSLNTVSSLQQPLVDATLVGGTIPQAISMATHVPTVNKYDQQPNVDATLMLSGRILV